MNFVCFVELEPAPVQEHEETVELGYVLAPVGVEVNSNGDVVEVPDGPQVGGNQRADPMSAGRMDSSSERRGSSVIRRMLGPANLPAVKILTY